MDKQLEEVSKIRKAVMPMMQEMTDNLKNDIHVHLPTMKFPKEIVGKHTIKQKVNLDILTKKMQKVFDNFLDGLSENEIKKREDANNLVHQTVNKLEAIRGELQKVGTINTSEIVKVINQLKTEDRSHRLEDMAQIVAAYKKSITGIEGTVEVKEMQKMIDTMDQLVKLNKEILDAQKQYNQNMPIENMLTKDGKKIPVMAVKVSNWEHMVSVGQGSTARNLDDRTFIREEYTYTTVNSTKVPQKVEKWTHDGKLTEIYEYDSEANPVVKSRSFEPSTTVGA